jgi:hypothetical protein
MPEGQLEKSWLVIIGKRVTSVMAVIFRLDWLYISFGFLFRVFQSLFQVLTNLLEGEGGVLWVFVLLALLLSLLSGINKP